MKCCRECVRRTLPDPQGEDVPCRCPHAPSCCIRQTFDDFDADELGLDPEEEYDA